jgi:uncharacterized protein (UPF0332 family)
VTKENQRRNAERELARAMECLAEARLLATNGHHHGAASRAYYCVFHAARALLFSIGLETHTHRGLMALLGEHFVRPGLLASDLGRAVAHLQRDREDADYTSSAVFTEQDTATALGQAGRFLDAVRQLLGPASE